MIPSLPPTVEAYFAASNAGRPEDVAGAFAPGGEVRDERETHRGRAAIAAWSRSALARYAMQSAPLAAEQDGDVCKVFVRVTGDFPGSPLDLTHRFDLSADGIRILEIG